MAESQKRDADYGFKFREDEELEFFTELAVHECERWIQTVTKKSLPYPDDTRKSLENGVFLCELLNCLQPGSVSRINRLSTPIAGLDNINVFLRACKTNFALSDVHLFNPSDLEDLSQRAIAESAYLKQEYERRLRNVAVTIYWLGKFANRYYPGPQLDLSAFSALIHHRQQPDSVELNPESRYISRTSSNSSGDWPQGSPLSAYGQPGTVEYPDSLEETASDVCSNMSMNHYSSAMTLNKSQDQAKDQNHSVYSSTPDLSLRGSSHRRYSSTDSLEDSYYSGQSGGQSGHSRQGSQDSQEVIYPTRRKSTQILRKQSSSADPLQYIKTKGAQDLAHIAEVQMRVAAESKKGALLSAVKDDDNDWQDELNSWKSRRKSQSERSYHMKEQIDEMQKEKAGETLSASAPKTFSQMQEEREQRRSTRKFYPIQDDGDNYEDDDAFVPAVSRQLHNSINLSKDEVDDVAQYSRNNEGVQAKETGGSNRKPVIQNRSDTNNGSNRKPVIQNRSDTNNNNYSNMPKQQNDKKASLPSSASQASSDGDHMWGYRQRGHDRGTKQGKSQEDAGARFGGFLNTNNSSSMDSGHALLQDSRHEGMPSRGGGSLHAVSETANRSDSTYKTREVSTAGKLHSERDVMAVKSSRNIGSRTQNKIGSILKNFEDSTAKSSVPKEGYNERININARRSAFENVSENDYRHDSSFSHSEGVLSEDSGDDSLQEVRFNSHQTSVSSATTTSAVTSTSAPSSSLPTVTSTVSPGEGYASTKNTQQDYVSKTIKISQKANSEKGFGFFLSGGADKQTSLYVSKVVLGSAADVCDLKTRDVIRSVNQMDVSAMTAAEVGEIISSSVSQGYIEINVLREKDDDDFDEFGSSSDEGEEIISSPGYRSSQTQGIKDLDKSEDRRQDFTIPTSRSTGIRDHEAPTSQYQDRNEDRRQDFTIPTSRSTGIRDHEAPTSQYQDRNEDRRQDFTIPTSSSTGIRDQEAPTGDSKFSQNSADKHKEDGDDTDFGPPALLRRWQQQQQQQRQKEKDNIYDDDITNFYSKINLNTSFAHSESEREKDFSVNQETGYGSGDWSSRVAELTKIDAAQDEQREKEKARLLEERRAERRARIMNSASPGSSFSQTPALIQEARASSQDTQAQTSRAQASPRENQTSPPQSWAPASQTRPSPPETWAPASQTQPSPPETRHTLPETRTSVSQSWTAPSQTRPPLPEARPSLPETQTLVPQTWAPVSQTRPSLPETRSTPPETQSSVLQSWALPSQTRISPANQMSLPSQTSTPVHMVVPKTFDGAVLQQEQSSPFQTVNSSKSTITTSSSNQTLLPSGFQTVKFLIDPRSKFVIDPRNRQGSSETVQPADLQVRYDYQANPDTEVTARIEEERERIRNEELQKLKEERQRAEEELLRKEKEERLQRQREEEQIQKEKELLRLEREKLLKEKEEFNRLREQQQLQQQQQFYQQQKQQEVSYEPSYQKNAYNNQIQQSNQATSSGIAQNVFQPILSQQDQRQAAGYNPQQRTEPQNHPGVLHPRSVHSGGHVEQTRNFHPTSSVNSAGSQARAHNQNTDLYLQSQIQQESHIQRPNSSGLPSRSLNVSNIQTTTRSDPDSSRNGLRFSREEMLVMNRTAKPMAAVHTDARDDHNQGQWSSAPITREAPSREEIHSLNSVPKAKLRSDTDWQSTESLNSPRTPKSISPQQPDNSKASWYQGREEKPGSKFSLFSSGDHWMVQEAERRRIAESEAKFPPRSAANIRPSSSGPIKPAGDTSNRWRDQGGFVNDQNNVSERLKPSSSMPAVIRQTLLQKTAGVRGSNEPVQSFPHSSSPSPTLQYHDSYHNQILSAQAPQQPHPRKQQWQYNPHLEPSHHLQQQVAPGGPAPPPQRQHEIKMSGSQLCSHCEQELGYGAAMVIESLGLFFHVQCFKCCVCHTSLGTGDQGADVRVRVNKLHCPNCYSNDEVFPHPR